VGKQLATGTELGWHTDDAHDTEPCRYIALLCLQGGDAHTCISPYNPNLLEQSTRNILSQPLFTISSDESYRIKSTLRTPILDKEKEGALLLRFDPYFTTCDAKEGQQALDTLAMTFNSNHESVCLKPGDFLVINNRIVAHARSSFTPDYSASDRWLQRLIIT